MKLKKAIKLAKEQGFNYVAVDGSLEIWAYASVPEITSGFWTPSGHHIYLGAYTGSKLAHKTLREVK